MLTLLATAQLLDPLLIVMLAVETHANPYARVILHPTGFLASLSFLSKLFPFLANNPVRLPLDNQPPTSRRHQLLKDFRKLPAHLLESPLDRLILPLIQHADQLLDALLRTIQLPAAVLQRLLLRREVVVLLKRLLVHVPVFLEGLVDFVQALDDGVGFGGGVFLQGAVREDAEVANAGADFGGLEAEDAPLADGLFGAFLRFLDLHGYLVEG